MATGIIINQTVDPSAGAGLAAGVGSILLRDNGGVGELWEKVGAGDTAWTLVGMVAIQDEGTPVVSTGTVDFAGAGVSVAQVGAKAVVTVPGGGTGVNFGPATPLTIAAGAIDVTGLSYVLLNGEGSAADRLDVMTGGVDGQVVLLESVGVDITLDSNFRFVNLDLVQIVLNYTAYQVMAIYSAHDGTWTIHAIQRLDVISSASDAPFISSVIASDIYGVQIGGVLGFTMGGASTGVTDDGLLQVSAVNFWFDPTNGAAYLMLKGKTANGTVVTGKVRLGATVQTYTESNVTTDRAYNANSTTVDELADVVGTLIADLRAQGLVA